MTVNQQQGSPPQRTFRKVSSREYIKISRGAMARRAGLVESLLGKLGYMPTPPPPPRFGLNGVSPGRAALTGTGLGVLTGLGGVAAANPEETMGLIDSASSSLAGGANDLTEALMQAGRHNPLSQALSDASYGGMRDASLAGTGTGEQATVDAFQDRTRPFGGQFSPGNY